MLSNKEILQIESSLKELDIEAEVSVEILDHLICSIERSLLNGESFENAFELAWGNFHPAEITEINSNYKRLKQIKMLKKFILPICFFLCLSLFAYAQYAPQIMQWQPPINKEANAIVASDYGYHLHPINKIYKLHKGIDYAAPLGTKVFAVKEGLIVEVIKSNSGYGNYVVVEHQDSIQTKYAQLHDILVQKGDKVTTQNPIGTVGSSGASTGPHLHFEVIKNGKHINPTSLDSVFVSQH